MEKVCHLSSHHSPKSVRIFKKQCVSLAKEGYNVTYVVPGEGLAEEKGVNLLYVKQKKGFFHRLIAKPYRVYKKAKAVNADIYHFHDPELLPYGFLLKKARKKVIYDIHEDLPAKIKDINKPKIKVLLKIIAEKINYILENKILQTQGRQNIAHLNDKIIAKKLINVYKSVIANGI